MRYYIDTCIWFDYFENRSDKFRPLGEWALRLINKIIDEEGEFIFSDVLEKELETQYPREQIINYLKIIPLKLIKKVYYDKTQLKEAYELNKCLKISKGDILHAILARDANSFLISRDKHFSKITFINCYKPEDLI